MPNFTVYKGSKEGRIVKGETSRPDLEHEQVLVKVTAAGLCGTDEHFKHLDMCLGHEGAGVVESVGPLVKNLKIGDHVGWGYQHNCCGTCKFCLTGREQYCTATEMYGISNFDQGGFASHGVWRESFLHKIPEGLTDEDAAPLMCAGATVFNALHTYRISPTDRVGVMGVGGLGHLAIQFAAKMGCDVVVLSGSNSKKEEAMKFGATEFISMNGKTELKVSRKIDVLLVTTSASPDWKTLLPILEQNATVIPLNYSEGNFEIPHPSLLFGGYTIQGSIGAARQVYRQMLEFAALHKIKPVIMEFPMTESGIEDAMSTLKDGKMRYRGVVKPQ